MGPRTPVLTGLPVRWQVYSFGACARSTDLAGFRGSAALDAAISGRFPFDRAADGRHLIGRAAAGFGNGLHGLEQVAAGAGRGGVLAAGIQPAPVLKPERAI